MSDKIRRILSLDFQIKSDIINIESEENTMPHFTPQTTKAIRAWLKENNFHVGCRLGKVMSFDPEGHYLIMPYDYDDCIDLYFMQFLQEHGLDGAPCVYAMSVLHEIGHSETENLFNEEEWDMDYLIKMVIPNKYKDTKECLYHYWNTRTELAANLWAIMYANTFPEKVSSLSLIIKQNLAE